MTELIQHFDANAAGRDFVVGDIHGCFYMLEALLDRLDFDYSCDRLFSVGDLIDRGPDSERAGDFIDAPWFHAIRGNHEQMLLDGVARGGQDRALWYANGGDWFDALDTQAAHALTERIRTLPLAICVDLADGDMAALVHANVVADSWPHTQALLTEENADPRQLARLMWDRTRAHALLDVRAAGTPDQIAVEGIDVVYFGHTPIPAATACANTRWIDTGAFMGRWLSIAQLGVDGALWSLAGDLDECQTGWRWV